jgi:hypothetical protein
MGNVLYSYPIRDFIKFMKSSLFSSKNLSQLTNNGGTRSFRKSTFALVQYRHPLLEYIVYESFPGRGTFMFMYILYSDINAYSIYVKGIKPA